MSRSLRIAAGLLALVFVGLLLYGILIGDAGYVLDNAQSICFT